MATADRVNDGAALRRWILAVERRTCCSESRERCISWREGCGAYYGPVTIAYNWDRVPSCGRVFQLPAKRGGMDMDSTAHPVKTHTHTHTDCIAQWTDCACFHTYLNHNVRMPVCTPRNINLDHRQAGPVCWFSHYPKVHRRLSTNTCYTCFSEP